MVNLLDSTRYCHGMPWGNVINPGVVGNQIGMDGIVAWDLDSVRMWVGNGNGIGIIKDKDWNDVRTTTVARVGCLVSKDSARTHYGAYEFEFMLPRFRGSWPAIWLVDLVHESMGGMGIPPEIDIMEHFRKDCFLSRFGMTMSFHGGWSYKAGKSISRKWWRLMPVDRRRMSIVFYWGPDGMYWIVNGELFWTIMRDEVENYPTNPMNLIMNAGVGLDWKPDWDKAEEFVIYNAHYYPL